MTIGRHGAEPGGYPPDPELHGPGWAHLQVYSPWRDDSPVHASIVFKDRQTARTDLYQVLARDPESREPAEHLRSLIDNKAHDKSGLLLYYLNGGGLMWVWAYFPVAARASSVSTAREFMNGWREDMLSDELYRAIIDHEGVTVLDLAKWF
ncbi:hypothetical protein GCM10009853_023000 [Glycomyces scopariae]